MTNEDREVEMIRIMDELNELVPNILREGEELIAMLDSLLGPYMDEKEEEGL